MKCTHGYNIIGQHSDCYTNTFTQLACSQQQVLLHHVLDQNTLMALNSATMHNRLRGKQDLTLDNAT